MRKSMYGYDMLLSVVSMIVFYSSVSASYLPTSVVSLPASAASAAHELIMPTPHDTAANRTVLGALSRYLHTSKRAVRWAKLGVNLELFANVSIGKYMQEYEQCMARVHANYEKGVLLDTNHDSDGNQQQKLIHRLGFVVTCRDEALEAFNSFLKNADQSTARRAALFLRASQLLSQNNGSIIPPEIQKALKAERKKVRPFLRNYMINFGESELRGLQVRQYLCTHLCDSDDEEEGQEALNVKMLKKIMKVDISDSDDSKEDRDDNDDDPGETGLLSEDV